MAEQSVAAAILERAAHRGSATAIVDAHGCRTYGELADEVRSTAAAMLAAGIGHGDTVGIWAPNSGRWITTALGVQAVGAAIVPINTRYKTREAAYPLERTDAALLVADSGFMGIDGQVAAEMAGGRTRVVDFAAAENDAISWETFIAAGGNVRSADVEAALAAVGPGDLSDVIFTSGSTGRPKGVRHLHGATLRQTTNTIEENGISFEDRLLVINPFFHVFGYTGGWMPGLLAGATVYPMAVFDVDEVLRLIEAERITYFPGPPTIFHSILESDSLAGADVSSLRASVTGSADVPVQLIQRMLDDLTFERVIQAYGMTECGTATNTLAGDSPEVVATTVGVACRDLEVRIVDAENQPVPIGEAGEIVVRGYAVMDGYFADDEATAAAIDGEGWLHTGDWGSCDGDGYFRILGRIKGMFIVGGFNVYPAEVEDVIREHPAVSDVAVIGVPDTRLGEVGCAFVLSDGSSTAEELIAWCRERMANFRVPRHVEFLESFPLTGSNKVARAELRDLSVARRIGDVDVT